MPIYEFKCLQCNNVFELLKLGEGDQVRMRCPHCRSEDFERVISTTHVNVAHSASGKSASQRTTRTCSGGSCTTYTIPGPNG